jgi:hypothetical protein
MILHTAIRVNNKNAKIGPPCTLPSSVKIEWALSNLTGRKGIKKVSIRYPIEIHKKTSLLTLISTLRIKYESVKIKSNRDRRMIFPFMKTVYYSYTD